jgi:hypothetical protein
MHCKQAGDQSSVCTVCVCYSQCYAHSHPHSVHRITEIAAHVVCCCYGNRGMIECGLHAVLVKVAALGLDPHKHLGRTIAQLEPHLHRLAARYGSNVCGEGGEYESLTLDAPCFTHGKVVLDETEVSGSAGGRPAGWLGACMQNAEHLGSGN